jgi:hypothetical protein
MVISDVQNVQIGLDPAQLVACADLDPERRRHTQVHQT